MNDITHEVDGNDVGEGVNDVDDEGGSFDKDADTNDDDYEEVDDFDVVDGEEDFVSGDDDDGVSKVGLLLVKNVLIQMQTTPMKDWKEIQTVLMNQHIQIKIQMSPS